MNVERGTESVYRRLIEGWNANDAEAMSAAIAADGLVIGFDGSQMIGRDAAYQELAAIFADHRTATFVPDGLPADQ